MRKQILWIGVAILLLGILSFFLAGATFGNLKLPFLYGTNQTYYLFLAGFGLIVAIIGAILKPKAQATLKK